MKSPHQTLRALIVLATFAVAVGCGSNNDAGQNGTDNGTNNETNNETNNDPNNDPNNGTNNDPNNGTNNATNNATNNGTTGTNNGTTGTNNQTIVDEGDYAAIILGTLADADLADAQANHDQIAMGGEDAAKMLGDYGHKPMLGTTILGTTENEFLAIDRWDNLAGAQTLYSDADFQAAFSTLFEGDPSVTLYEWQEEYYQWGDFNVADANDPHFFAIIRGRLASDDPQMAMNTHNAIAMGGEEDAKAAGDLAHLVYLDVEDPREFLAIDIWASDAAIEAVYTSEEFQGAFDTLFESPPTIGIYQSTDWHAW